ncbi:unnamed protein product [Sordaria macrospora k-hell]|uniref:WGS project CABT00000000 data, contig 2.7 n=1 Tax=Sordaria macrospora (strain ATCC MYA-333 / DSM 997 / K(L3346) / K-hell) TaxID=771870 RepID=F7VUC6_SORMK|nr:uncharacterized protein SMAC_03057 [Sordaria macrospora k-hell]CCC09115.1 unnamed protein product [Sordaria macrospora k-hell]
MANGSEGSKLSTAANIIGLLTFALSALNLVILFDLDFAGFKGNSNCLIHAPANTRIPEEKSKLDDSQPEEGLQEILKDVQACYEQAKVIISETETTLHLLSEQISVAGYARATVRSILRLDLAGSCKVSVAVWRQLKNWRESRESMGKLEDNYQELGVNIWLAQQCLPFTIDRQANTITEIANTVKTRVPTELTPAEPTPSTSAS